MSYDASFCFHQGSKPASKIHYNSGSSSASEIKKGVKPENFLSLYIIVKLLGSGAFGVVNLMQHQISGIFYAVKEVKKRKIVEDNKVRSEIEYGMMLNSQHICKVFDYYEDDNNIYIIMEYLEGIDLCDFIRKDPKFFVENPRFFWLVVKSILQGLVYLHSQGITHFDIKPENVFISLDMNGNIIGVKLIDLGYAVKVDEKSKIFWGTAAYMAPELFHLFWSTGFKADIWSLGMTAYAMLMAYLPIRSKHENPQLAKQDIYKKIDNLLAYKKITPFLKWNDNNQILLMQDFITSCFIVDPVERPSAQQLLDYILATETKQILK
jgi:serine/threonine protein kinase